MASEPPVERGVPDVTADDPTSPSFVTDDLAAARRRVAELEAELRECEDELLLRDDQIEDLRAQLEQADLLLKEGGEARLALQQRVDELEDEDATLDMLSDAIPRTPDPPPQDDRRRIERLEELLFDSEQELEAAEGIIGKQDRDIADLKLLLDLEEAVRRKLERRLAEAEDAPSSATRPAIPPVSKEPAASPPKGYPPGYRANPVVEAMIAAASASGKQ